MVTLINGSLNDSFCQLLWINLVFLVWINFNLNWYFYSIGLVIFFRIMFFSGPCDCCEQVWLILVECNWENPGHLERNTRTCLRCTKISTKIASSSPWNPSSDPFSQRSTIGERKTKAASKDGGIKRERLKERERVRESVQRREERKSQWERQERACKRERR